jgi:hypothetical protein
MTTAAHKRTLQALFDGFLLAKEANGVTKYTLGTYQTMYRSLVLSWLKTVVRTRNLFSSPNSPKVLPVLNDGFSNGRIFSAAQPASALPASGQWPRGLEVPGALHLSRGHQQQPHPETG